MNEPKKTTLAKTTLGWSADKTEVNVNPPWGAQPYAHLLEPARGSSPEHPHHQVQVHQDYVQQAQQQQQQVKHYPEGDPYNALAAQYGVQPRTNANVAPRAPSEHGTRRAKGSTPPPAPRKQRATQQPLFNDPTKPHAYNMQSYATEYEQATVPLTAEQYQAQQQHIAQHQQATYTQQNRAIEQTYAQQQAQYEQQANAQVYSQHAQTHEAAQYTQAQYAEHAQQANHAAQQAQVAVQPEPAQPQYSPQDYTQYAAQLQAYAAQQEAYAQQQAHAQQQQQTYAAQQAYTAQQEAYAQQQPYAQQQAYPTQQEAHAQQPAQPDYQAQWDAYYAQQAAAQQPTYDAAAYQQGYAQQYAPVEPVPAQDANAYAQQYQQQVAAYEQKQREEQSGNYLGNMAAKLQKRAEKQKAKLEAALKKDSKSADKREGQIPGAVATIDQSSRRDFVKKTYKTLFFAILTFTVLLWAFRTIDPLVELLQPFVDFALGGRWNWGVVLAAFMASSILAERWSHAKSRAMQYMGLGFYVLAEAVIFVPLMAVVEDKTLSIVAAGGGEPHIVRDAAIMTLAVFGMLTASVVFSKKDFSFLRSGLFVASGAAISLVVLSLMFGFGLGLIFSAAMVILAGGYILYHTSQVLAHHDPEAHVAAALDLFSSVALMFWYMIRIFMRARD